MSSQKSRVYRNNVQKIEQKIYTVEEAVAKLLELDQPKHKSGVSVQIALNLNIDPEKSDQLIRTSFVLPHGNGKQKKVIAFVLPENAKKAQAAGADIVADEETISKIKTTGKIDFDAAVAEPAMMKHIAPLARVLGTAGVMPSPKNQTVGENIAEMIQAIKSGKVDVKNDKGGNIHILIGKISKSFDALKLIENINATLAAIEKSKPEGVKKTLIQKAVIKSVYSPSIRIV